MVKCKIDFEDKIITIPNISNLEIELFDYSEFKFISNIFNYDYDLRCQRCKNEFFWNGCPSCGNTFINRKEMRITS